MNLNTSSIAQFQLTAEEALQRGWSIIPVGLDKKPLIPSWKPFQGRSPTQAELDEWRRMNPPAWAVVTGAISGIVTLDFDLGRGGDESYFKLQLQCYDAGIDLSAHRKTGGGGYHIDVIHPGWPVKTLQSGKPRTWSGQWPGLDIRADGGYAVFTGHNESGAYSWLRDAEPYHAADILPGDLLEMLGLAHPPAEPAARPPSAPAAHLRPDAERILEKYLAMATTGSRNSAWAECCVQLRDNGYSEAETLSIGESYVARAPQNGHPYTLAEMRATVRSIYSRPPREPWAPPPNAPAAAPHGSQDAPLPSGAPLPHAEEGMQDNADYQAEAATAPTPEEPLSASGGGQCGRAARCGCELESAATLQSRTESKIMRGECVYRAALRPRMGRGS